MRKSLWNKVALIAFALAIVGVIAYSFVPTPVAVELREVRMGDLEVTVEDDGKTRIKEKYIVSAPLAGRLARVQLHAGDRVVAGETLLTTLDPIPPALLDARSRAEAVAKVKALEAIFARTEPMMELVREKVSLAQKEFDRAQKIFERQAMSPEDRDRAENRLLTAQKELRTAEITKQVAIYELEQARAALVHVQRPESEETADADDWRIEIRSPVTGRVLRVFQESTANVNNGTPLMEIGDPGDLEVVIDVLSSDAVKISPGNPVRLEEWGGSRPLLALVRHVEPSGFTKVSALGIEEQRVNVILDLQDPPAERANLGDDFRVEARIIVDQARYVLKVPTAALVRHGEGTAAFVAEHGRARLRPLQLGRRGRLEDEVISGLATGERVIIYPSDKVRDGVTITGR